MTKKDNQPVLPIGADSEALSNYWREHGMAISARTTKAGPVPSLAEVFAASREQQSELIQAQKELIERSQNPLNLDIALPANSRFKVSKDEMINGKK